MKFIRVNMTDQSINIETTPEAYQMLGGRALTSTLVNSEVPATCDALGPENKLVIAPGLLSGSAAVMSGRLSIGSKSPLTGTIKESNAGGQVAQVMARLGYAGIIIEGLPEQGKLYKIFITGDSVKTIQKEHATLI